MIIMLSEMSQTQKNIKISYLENLDLNIIVGRRPCGRGETKINITHVESIIA
ncbi:rCG58010 [Rattus norvegicus]|uniref:RCG58010 n=1 Tax=Rattus norvegicus TaxID=10116 RepID=A6J4M9_RAT|nr:rCG58010 [Rattus norvegicus]